VGPLLVPELSNSLILTTQPPPGLGQAPFPQEVIQFLKGVHLWEWDQEVEAGIAHQAFHQTLLVGLGRGAEATLK
jgi:hypothetical protein